MTEAFAKEHEGSCPRAKALGEPRPRLAQNLGSRRHSSENQSNPGRCMCCCVLLTAAIIMKGRLNAGRWTGMPAVIARATILLPQSFLATCIRFREHEGHAPQISPGI